MKKLITVAMAVVLCVTCISASAAFTKPTDAQILAAAGSPADLTALLQGASAQEAAEVVRLVIVAATGLGLDAPVQSARIKQITAAAFAAVGAATGSAAITPAAFAEALGRALGGSHSISENTAVLDAVATAVNTAGGGGTGGAALTSSFGVGLTAAHLYKGQ